MKPVPDYHQVKTGLFFWQGYDPASKVDLSSAAIVTPEGLVFIDPILLAEEPLLRLASVSRPAGIVLTNANHARASSQYRQRFDIPIHAHIEAKAEPDIAADEWIETAGALFGNLTVQPVPGAGLGEIALHAADEDGVLFLGDAIINLEAHGFMLLPPKYCRDAKQLRRSVEKLLQFPFETVTFAHGLPIASRARERLRGLIEPL